MPTPRHFRVFISSPGDVAEEREVARDFLRDTLPVRTAIRGKATFDPVTWDDPNASTPMLAHLSPQAAVNRGLPKPSDCDIVIVILWSRMGTPLLEAERKQDGDRYVSGTEYEYLDALTMAQRTGSPKILVYRRTEIPNLPITLPPDQLSEAREQWCRVEAFFAGFENTDGSLHAGYHVHKDAADFRRLLSHHLEELVQSILAEDIRQPSSLPSSSATRSTGPLSLPRLAIREVANELMTELDWIDQDFDFDSSFFTPLEAKVRVRQAGKAEDHVSDLLTELTSKSPGQLRLVLGLPGAGKSVAMREFARQKLRDIENAGVLAIYVNLRDWTPDRVWTEKELPTRAELEAFLQQRLSFPTKPEMAAYFADFRQQHADGKLYWIFDSFDELPAILDAGTGRADGLVKSVARLLVDFVTGNSTQRDSRGIIASRYERKPDLPPALVTVIELQPFDDYRIREAFARNREFPKALVDDIFQPPGNLVPLARTPFYHALIVDFAIRSQRLPGTTAELFESFVMGRLSNSPEVDLKQPDAETVGILRMAEDIAAHLFSSKRYGLGCPLHLLRDAFPQRDFQTDVSRLERARIVRIGAPPDNILTFSHRRMHEYLLVRHKVREQVPFDIEWVARDTRDRDSSVLHVELADDAECQAIAQKCWKEVQATAALHYDVPEFYRGINCQRFLAEAFRTRRSAVEPVSGQIETHIISCLEGTDIIRAKLAAESIGLLSQKGLEQAVALAVSQGGFWVRDTAIDACRFLPELSPAVRGSIWRILVVTDCRDFISDYARLKFSFGLSPPLREVSDLIDRRAEDIRRWNWTWPIAALLVPMVLCFVAFGHLIDSFFLPLLLVKTGDRNSAFDPGQRHLSRIAQKFLSSGHVDSGDLSSLGLVGASDFRAACVKQRGFNVLLGGIVAFLALTLLLPAWFKIPNELLIRAFSYFGIDFDYLGSLQRLGLQFGGHLHLILLVIAGWTLLGGIAARHLAGLRFPLFVSGESIGNVRPKRLKPVQVITALFIPIPLLLLGLILHSIGYVVRSAWLMRLADYSDLGNFGFGFGSLMAVGLVMAAFEAVKDVLRWRRDRRRFEKALQTQAHGREQISSIFSSFETSSYREKYVDFLTKEAVRPFGQWPAGSLPSHGDVASIKLARLEHDWRGLNK